MNTRFLESFVVVADCGSIAEASRRLNITPAALAQQLKALENELGHKLVQRAGRTVRPTASGLAVLRHARPLIDGIRDLQAIAANDEPVGRLRIGATATAMTGMMPDIVAGLRERHPRIEFFLRPDSSVNLYHSVLAGELDAAVIVRPHFVVPKSIGWMTLRKEPLVLIAPEGMELSKPHTVLSEQVFIRYDRNQWGGQIVDRYLRAHNLAVKEWLELDALDAIAALVSRRLGVAIVPDWAPPWPEGLPLEKKILRGGEAREVGILWNSSTPQVAAVNALVEFCAVKKSAL